MVNKVFRQIEQLKYGKFGIAITVSIAVFTLGWTILEVIGIGGSSIVFLSLSILGLLIFISVFSYLLNKRIYLLEIGQKESQAPELKAKIEPLYHKLDPESVSIIHKVIEGYEETLKGYQDKSKKEEIPAKPILIEEGKFFMGCDDEEADEKPSHEVFVKSFLIEPFSITNQQFSQFIQAPENKEWTTKEIYKRYGIPYYLCEFANGNYPEDKWDHPVVWVNWYAAIAFCNWRSRTEGRQEVYKFIDNKTIDSDLSNNGWRLPTEAEWEKAARAGDNSKYPFNGNLSPTKANYRNHYKGTTSVGRFASNKFGLFDMIGNIKEWCHDIYKDDIYKENNRFNPIGGNRGEFKSFRGGSFMDNADVLRFSRRGKLPPENTNPDFGFRCVRSI